MEQLEKVLQFNMIITKERYDELIHAAAKLSMIRDLVEGQNEEYQNENEMLAGIRFLLGCDSGSRVD